MNDIYAQATKQFLHLVEEDKLKKEQWWKQIGREGTTTLNGRTWCWSERRPT